MKYIWVANRIGVGDFHNWKIHLLPTKSAVKFGDKMYFNDKGYVQKKNNSNEYIGWVVKCNRKLNPLTSLILLERLYKLILKRVYAK